LAVSLLQSIGAFYSAELRSYDLRFRIRGHKAPSSDILLVTIDEKTRSVLNKSLNQIGRDDYARLIGILSKSGARLIVFDIDFASNRDGDERLAEAISCAGNVVMSSFIAMGSWVRPNPKLLDTGIPCPMSEAVTDAPKQVIVGEEGKATIEWNPDPQRKADAYRVYYSIEPFDDPSKIQEGTGGSVDVSGEDKSLTLTLQGVDEGAPLYVSLEGLRFGGLLGVGAVNIIEDPDDRVRRIPLVVGRSADDPDKQAALSLETSIRATFKEAPKLVESDTSRLRFEVSGRALEIPLVEGRMLINYRGGRDTFSRVSFGDALDGRIEPARFRNKIILVGNTHHLSHDEYPTPFGSQAISPQDSAETGVKAGFTSGLEIHANAIDTILSNDHIYPLGSLAASWINSLKGGKISQKSYQRIVYGTHISLTLGLGLLATILFILLRIKIEFGAAIFIALEGMVLGAAVYAFDRWNIWAPVVGPLVVVAATYGGGLFYHVWVEGREKRWIKDTFGKYLAPSVVEQITRDPSRLKLGGDELTLTAFFSDIQGFTSISEQLASPQRLVELLNEYLSVMAEIIEQYEGTVDKYEGDAVIAFWGAPMYFPDHALKACLAALDQQKKFAELRELWKTSGKWPAIVGNARVRMGINTGMMVVGNMGSKGRMNYTIMGDAVNLASRLEGVNKQYGSLVMISEDTYAHVKDHVEARELDTIRVVGKAKPVKIYELIAQKGDLDEKMGKTRAAFEEGLELYRLRKWEHAITSFEKALHFAPDDGPSKKYIERCRTFIAEPPPDTWDGVFVMKTK